MWKIILGGGIGLFVLLYVLTLTVPGFIMFGVVVFLFIMTIFLSYLNGGIKATGIAILVFAASFLAFTYYYNATCGPNNADVKVMKPMAEKISKYIMTKGIPESLKDIPELPYALEGCERSEEYLNVVNGDWKQTDIKHAQLIRKTEKCILLNKNKKINILLSVETYLSDREIYISLEMRNDLSKTVANIDLKKNGTHFLVDYPLNFGSSKNGGICTTMKQ